MQASLILVSGLSPKRDILSMLNLTNESPDKPELELQMNCLLRRVCPADRLEVRRVKSPVR